MAETAKFRRKMAEMKGLVRDRLTDAIERQADAVVAEMRLVLSIQYPEVAAQTDFGWTWGDELPRGAIRLEKTSFGTNAERMAVTIYATAKQGSEFSVSWFEFGTAPRVTKTGASRGQITAGPFFFPVYRANRQRILNNLRATLRRAVKKINAM